MTLFLLAVAFALSISALCSLLEATLLSFTPSQVAALSERRPRLAAIWQGFKRDIQRPIAVILLVNTSAHTIGATVAGAKFEEVFIAGQGHGQHALILFSVVFTFLMLTFTEILPKTLGVLQNARIAPVIALPLQWSIWLLTPALWFVHLVNRPFTRGRGAGGSPATLEEISALAGMARVANLIGRQEEHIIRSASHLQDITAKEVMIPEEQVTFMSTSQSLNDAIMTAHMDPHTRFPVCREGDRDQVLGYVNFKEMIFHVRVNPYEPRIEGIIRRVHFASPEDSAAELLRVFVEQHAHMAIVQEGGRTLGLVTLEDIVEELVGEIVDEFDRAPRACNRLSGGVWMVGGGYPISALARDMEVELPDLAGSVSAWMIRRLGRPPRPNEVLEVNQARFTVRRVRRNRVFEAAVEVYPRRPRPEGKKATAP